MVKKNIAELFVDTLVLARVKRVYGVAGDSLNGITDVIRTDERIKWVHVRHEETAAFAAGAETNAAKCQTRNSDLGYVRTCSPLTKRLQSVVPKRVPGQTHPRALKHQ
jgi:thiamine pyrophosphate-dependent enzyme